MLNITVYWGCDKFAFEFDNVRTANVFSRFEIHGIFSHTRRRIRTSGLQDQHHMSTPTGHRNNNCTLPNSLKGPKIILDMADNHVSKDGPFRILGNALTYLLSDFFGITFFIFYHRHVNVWLNSHSHSHLHSNGFVLWNSHSTNANFSWLRHIPTVYISSFCDLYIRETATDNRQLKGTLHSKLTLWFL